MYRLSVMVKKSFNKPGQKKETPPKNDPIRIFYTSLLKQNKDSKMALRWCLEHGLLGTKKASEAIVVLELSSMKLKDEHE